MGIFQRIRDFFKEPRNTFCCDHCKKKSIGRWCLYCTDDSVKGLHAKGVYYDECGYPCKPTAVIKKK